MIGHTLHERRGQKRWFNRKAQALHLNGLPSRPQKSIHSCFSPRPPEGSKRQGVLGFKFQCRPFAAAKTRATFSPKIFSIHSFLLSSLRKSITVNTTSHSAFIAAFEKPLFLHLTQKIARILATAAKADQLTQRIAQIPTASPSNPNMSGFNQKADLAKLLWDRLPGTYTLTRGSNQNHLFEGRELPGTHFCQPFRGQSEITDRLPEDKAYQLEYVQRSNIKGERIAGGEVETSESRVFRLSNGECSIWNADSSGVVLEKLGVLVLRPGTASEKSKVMFEVVQEPRNAGREGDFIALWFSMGKEQRWKMLHQFQKDGEKIRQEDKYVKKAGK